MRCPWSRGRRGRRWITREKKREKLGERIVQDERLIGLRIPEFFFFILKFYFLNISDSLDICWYMSARSFVCRCRCCCAHTKIESTECGYDKYKVHVVHSWALGVCIHRHGHRHTHSAKHFAFDCVSIQFSIHVTHSKSSPSHTRKTTTTTMMTTSSRQSSSGKKSRNRIRNLHCECVCRKSFGLIVKLFLFVFIANRIWSTHTHTHTLALTQYSISPWSWYVEETHKRNEYVPACVCVWGINLHDKKNDILFASYGGTHEIEANDVSNISTSLYTNHSSNYKSIEPNFFFPIFRFWEPFVSCNIEILWLRPACTHFSLSLSLSPVRLQQQYHFSLSVTREGGIEVERVSGKEIENSQRKD